MTALHLPTAYFIAGILYLVMPLFVWTILRHQNERMNTLWCLGGLSFGLSLVLLGLRGKLPDVFTHGFALWLLFVGPLLRASALRLYLEKQLRLKGVLSLSLVFFASYVLIDVVLNKDDLRFIWSNLGTCGAVGWLAFWARNIYRRDRSDSARWIYTAYLTLSVLLCLRVLGAIFGTTQTEAMSTDTLSVLLIAWAVVSSIVGNIGFLGMFVERMTRKALESAKRKARQEEAARLNEQIAQLDRQIDRAEDRRLGRGWGRRRQVEPRRPKPQQGQHHQR